MFATPCWACSDRCGDGMEAGDRLMCPTELCGDCIAPEVGMADEGTAAGDRIDRPDMLDSTLSGDTSGDVVSKLPGLFNVT